MQLELGQSYIFDKSSKAHYRKNMIASYPHIFRIALPIMLSNAMLPLIGLVDAAVIGRMGAVAPLAAVGIGGTFIAMVFWLFNFFDITTTAVVGRARGSGDSAPIIRHMRRSFVLAALLSLMILALIPLWLILVPKLYAVSADVAPPLKTYVAIRLLGTPEAFIMHIITGYLLGYERTKTVLGYELIVQSVNVILDVVFVLGFHWGVAGVAWASVIAQYSGMAVMLFVLKDDLKPILRRFPRALGLDHSLREFLQNNGFLFLRALALHMVIVVFYRVGSQISDEIAAVNAVLMIYVAFAAQATDGFAVAIEILVAKSLGEKSVRALRGNILRASLISAAIAIVIVIVFSLFGRELFDLISTNPDLRNLAPRFLPWVSIAILVGVISWSLDGVFFGANKGREMMLSMIFTVAGYAVLILWLVPIWGNQGLWLAFVGSYALRSLGLMIFYPHIEREARL